MEEQDAPREHKDELEVAQHVVGDRITCLDHQEDGQIHTEGQQRGQQHNHPSPSRGRNQERGFQGEAHQGHVCFQGQVHVQERVQGAHVIQEGGEDEYD